MAGTPTPTPAPNGGGSATASTSTSTSTSTSRLDRLINLLDTGSTSSIRSSAARQLGQIAQRASSSSSTAPEDQDVKSTTAGEAQEDSGTSTSAWTEGVLLLARIVPLLRSCAWDTRIAAATAVGSICDSLPLWLPSPSPSTDDDIDDATPVLEGQASPLASFDLARLLASGTRLLSSAGKEFDAHFPASAKGLNKGSAAERLAHAKRSMQSLGLSVGGIGDIDLGMDVEAELRVGEMEAPPPSSASLSSTKSTAPKKEDAAPVVVVPDFSATSTLSARERNALKRKLKAAGGGSSAAEDGGQGAGEGPARKRQMLAPIDVPPTSSSSTLPASATTATTPNRPASSHAISTAEDAYALLNEDPRGWPFEPIVALLAADLFNPAWEVRHGAALGLRELMRSQGSGAGLFSAIADSKKSKDDDDDSAAGAAAARRSHAAFLEDVGVRLLSVCALDRLNDFVLDQVMAPVRETCAQALASLLVLPPSSSSGSAGSASDWAAAAPSASSVDAGPGDRSALTTTTARARGAGMPLGSVQAVHRALVQMIRQEGDPTHRPQGSSKRSRKPEAVTFRRKRGDPGYAWEVRHAGFLGLKYEVSARLDLLFDVDPRLEGGAARVKREEDVGEGVPSSLLGHRTKPNAYFFEVVELAVLGLRDEDDDIRSAAATTLLALAPILGSHPIPTATTTRVLDTLWASLAEAEGDDLGSSMASIMDLLAKLMEFEHVQGLMLADSAGSGGGGGGGGGSSLGERIRTLHPYFRHTIVGVRLSVLRAMSVFLRMGMRDTADPGAAAGAESKSGANVSATTWLDADLLRLLFQNLIVEERPNVREASVQAWKAAVAVLKHLTAHASNGSSAVTDAEPIVALTAPHLSTFFELIMTPLDSAVDARLLYRPQTKAAHARRGNGHASNGAGSAHDLDKSILSQDLALVGVDTVLHGRLGAAAALGQIMNEWPLHYHNHFIQRLQIYLSSSSALNKCLASCIVQEWAQQTDSSNLSSDTANGLSAWLIAILENPAPPTYAEMEVALSRLQRECQSLYWAFHAEARVARDKIPTLPAQIDALGRRADAFTVETARRVVGAGYEALLKLVGSKSKKTHGPALEERRRRVIVSLGFYQGRKEKSDVQVFAAVAGALVAMRAMPAKLNPVVRSIMNSVKFEENADLQATSAHSVAHLIKLCGESEGRMANPSDKIVKNLCAFVCQDTTRTTVFSDVAQVREGILSLDAEMASSGSRSGPGRPSNSADAGETEEVRQGKLIRRGAERALSELASLFGAQLFERVAALRSAIYEPLDAAKAPPLPTSSDERKEASTKLGSADGLDAAIAADAGVGQGVIDACTIIEVVIPYLDISLHPTVISLLAQLGTALQSSFAAVRSAAARCYGAVVDAITQEGMLELVLNVVPLLGDATHVFRRQGAMELVLDIVRRLETKLLPYVIFFIVPVLGRMTDADNKTRLAATNAFASLVKMVPLEAGLPDPAGFPADMLARRDEERAFLEQLLNGKVEEYRVPVKVNATLRKYQREGISWMAFLAKFKLHGVLCDDMGLGKTLQSITILSCSHHERAQAYKLNRSPEFKHLPSLVVCPSTLTSHWFHEIQQYANNLRPVLYVGQPSDRSRLQSKFHAYDVVITSYEVIRADISALESYSWNYCILDEGHIIKSAKTKISAAVKALRADHRLILSGTPIQNSVLELWSLFDFLMPGFLGTERAFNERYGKPILASREGKATAREQEAATLALEALHKQVLPFLLRRMKEDVLDDLPPKIIQDIECDLGEIQQALYDDFTSSQDRSELEDAFEEENQRSNSKAAEGTKAKESGSLKKHAFGSLQYLRKLVNHPILVLDKSNARHSQILKRKGGAGAANLRDIAHAPKLQVLKQLLNDCGIGLGSGGGNPGARSASEGDLSSDAAGGAAVSQHRVLIFCQLKQMLDIIEADLFAAHMPSVTYMRLDGSVAAEKRHGIVRTFNSDPSIDVLLLTTSVGGLGLTLTGADTVIFVEHDWNPMKDLQAMDRAHRLGQKKVVNVYRLITRNTLEQKIMGLQRFKLNVANSVITQDNAAMSSMDTDGILDLFGPSASSSTSSAAATANADGSGKKISQKQLLEQLQSMPDTEEDEYREMTSWRPT
ncbi:hypothetical protein V8E36_007476 [Tilletia maclaganii]